MRQKLVRGQKNGLHWAPAMSTKAQQEQKLLNTSASQNKCVKNSQNSQTSLTSQTSQTSQTDQTGHTG